MPIYDDADVPPETDAAPETDLPTTPTACRIRVTPDFVQSEDFEKLPSLLQSCKGDSPVEIAVGQRRWRMETLRVNPVQVGRFLKTLGLAVEE